ncbi:MAG: IspD/TarI family cytidylyltransferase [Anaerolineaceae bacterium]|jgi:2-C-methyl-D-erythritol 4-phosphate cytidylyltransferase
MNIAVILAGGTGQRLGAEIPKQFVEVLGKPLIVYALQCYEDSLHIDAIEVVCLQEYIPLVWEYAGKWNISKLRWVTPGGASCQDSTRNGIFNLHGTCSDDDIITLGMSTSVFVSENIIADSIKVCKEHGNSFAATQCIFNMAKTTDGISSNAIEYKEMHKTLNMPWTAPFGTFYRLYKTAYERNIETSATSYAPTLFLALGETIYLSKDTSKNMIHVTTQADLDIVEACLRLKLEKGE